ncbi:MAG: RHS repeat domain-containing protein [Reichenbachiella sp.]|uniref:RHS repeat domain-containing protein n=1 Tax=Reichenbachiella sp. TaxID=2184521 RepID=UPI0032665704
MKKQYQLILLFISIGNLNLLGQGMPEVIPPSPNSASLGEYGNIPVDKSSGTPNISIPLYNIQVDDISVPISISFHASGHKVGSRASWVGLGWSLNAGGVVTRSMRGRPDESGFFYNMSNIKSWEDDGLMPWVWLDHTGNDPAVIDLKHKMFSYYAQSFDVQADIFYYNFPGGAGKFMFNHDESITQFPYQDLKIVPTGVAFSQNVTTGEIGGFAISDMNGIQYSFGEEEVTTVNYPISNTGIPKDTYHSSWYLTSMFSKRSGKTVYFGYSGGISLVDDVVTSDSYVESISMTGSDHSVDPQSSTSLPVTLAKYVDNIVWEGGKIIFYKSSNREDFPIGGQRLDSVKVLDVNDHVIKFFVFEYDYFSIGSEAADKHLKLISVTERSVDGETNKPPHSFEYIDGVPSRTSKAMDHFGYYNAQVNNFTLVPSFENINNVTVNLANREPGNATSKVGMLKRIIYPTGGSSEFEYEAHEYTTGSSSIPFNQLATRVRDVSAEKCDVNGLLYYVGVNGLEGFHCEEVQSDTITIPSNARANKVEVTVGYDPNNAPAITPGAQDFYVKIYLVEGATETLVFSHEYLSDFSINDLLINGGVYRIETKTDVLGTRIRGRITAWYDDTSIATVYPSVYTGGIRIAKIGHYSGDGRYRKINYEYNLESNTLQSSGIKLSKEPSYYSTYEKFINGTVGGQRIIQHSASPSGLLGHLNGSHIIYKEVVEKESGNGYKRTVFSAQTDELTPFNLYSPSSAESVSSFWKRGLLLKEKSFDESGNVIQQIENHYSYIKKDTSLSFVFEPHTLPGIVKWSKYRYAFNRQVSGWARLDSTVETYADHTKDLIKKTHYGYEPDIALILPTSMEYELGSALDYKETTTYLNDRINHVISPVTEKRVFNENDQLLYLNKSIYNSNFKLTNSQVFNASNELTKEVVFSNFNGLKPSFVQESNGINTVYLWSYGKSYPIAKILNATYSEVETAVGAVFIADLAADNQQSVIDTKLTTLRAIVDSNLPAAQLTTYTYKHGVGMTSVTDPNDRTTTYEYDKFNRLKNVFDQKGNLIKANKYHYINQ